MTLEMIFAPFSKKETIFKSFLKKNQSDHRWSYRKVGQSRDAGFRKQRVKHSILFIFHQTVKNTNYYTKFSNCKNRCYLGNSSKAFKVKP